MRAGTAERARPARHPFEHLEGRHGRPSVHPVDHDLRRAAAERGLHPEAIVRDPAAHQGEVPPVDRVLAEPLAQLRVGHVGLGHDEQPARAGIQSMDDPRAELPSRGSEVDPHPEQPIDERSAPPPSGGMRDEPTRLRNDEQVFVLEHDRHRRTLGRERAILREVDDDPLAAVQAEGLRSRPAVHPDVPRGDRALNIGAGRPDRCGHAGVQPSRVGDELPT
jgi:hypothetical protein